MPSRKQALRMAAGWARLGAWIGLLHLIHAPWGDLGGIVDERLRWSERFVMGSAAVLGWTLGGFALDRSGLARRRNPAGLRRWMLYPLGLSAAVALAILTQIDQREIAAIVFNGLVSYCAGFDLAFDGWPLMFGRRGGSPPDALDTDRNDEGLSASRRFPGT